MTTPDIEHLFRYTGEFSETIIASAGGAHVRDRDGREILDFTSGQMSAILGHAHPEIVATVGEAMVRLDHLHSAFLSDTVLEFTNALARPPARIALQGAAPEHRSRVQRGGGPDGEARDGPFRGGGFRPLVARRHRRRLRGDVQRRPARLRSADARRARIADAACVPVPFRIERQVRLARRARLRVRARRPAVGRQPCRDDRRTHPELGGHHRAPGRLPDRARRALPAPRDAAHPGRGADRPSGGPGTGSRSSTRGWCPTS